MKSSRLIFLIGLMALVPAVRGGRSQTLSYQATLSDPLGAKIEGQVSVEFRIYESAMGGTALWSEVQQVTPADGVISVTLGKVTPIPAGLAAKRGLYIGLSVNGEAEMSPRKPLGAAWRAMSAERASGLKVQGGSAGLSVSNASWANVSIAFPEPFQAPPVVMVGAPRDQIGSASFINVAVVNVTATGCTARFASLHGVVATGGSTFDWIAIGE